MMWLTTPGIAFSFTLLGAPELWEPAFARIGFARDAELERALGIGVFTHDWRAETPDVWSERVLEAQIHGTNDVFAASRAAMPAPMDREAFEQAVRDALRARTQPDTLAQSPLASARCAAGGGADAIARLIDEAVDSLGGHPRDHKLQRALVATYLKPAPTQEAAAERLGVPFSSYRRHLTKGIDRVIAWLWQRETGRAGGAATPSSASIPQE
jgi:hypothetical protein